MNPVLVVVHGESKGNSFPLTSEEVTAGRDSSNDICLRDFSVSRNHCVFRKDGENYALVDLDSSNGTFVNDVPVKERILRDQDRIKIGDQILVFTLGGETDPLLESDVIQEVNLAWRTTSRLTPEKDIYSRLLSLAPSERSTRDLKALLEFSQKMHGLRSLQVLEKELPSLVKKVIPVGQGCVLQVDDEGGFRLLGKAEKSFVVSRTILQEVTDNKKAVLFTGLHESGEKLSDSLQQSEMNSLLAVPVLVKDQVWAVMYLYTTDSREKFDEDDLQLIAGIAGITGMVVENASHLDWLNQERRRLQADVDIDHNMVGESKPMVEVYRLIAKVAPSETTVLLRGESGTGKELVARAIHSNSERSENPFVVVNCAALPETLLESELFGHEKGAFTGATSRKTGKLEVADKGSVFLDEIAELSPALQSKLLRLLQEKELERIGGHRPIPLDVRFIAATNQDLEAQIKKGKFREDLFYRLNVVSITLPPLRERREDIPLLSGYFIGKYAAKAKRVVRGVSPQARSLMMSHDWPGNVRELENTIERAVVLGSDEMILPEDLPESVLESSPSESALPKFQQAVQEAKKRVIQDALQQTRGNYTEAAKVLGVHVNHLHRLIRNLKIPKPN